MDEQDISSCATDALKMVGLKGGVFAVTRAQDKSAEYWVDFTESYQRVIVQRGPGEYAEVMTMKIAETLRQQEHLDDTEQRV